MSGFRKVIRKLFKNSDMFGTVSVAKHKLIVKNPKDPAGEFATIAVPSDSLFSVSVNDKKVVGECKVSETDKIDIHLKEPKEPEISFEHRISEDRITVFLRKNVTMGSKYLLKNSEPSNSLVLEIEEVPYIEPHSKDFLLQYLDKEKFVGKADEIALQQIGLSHESIELPVLNGSTPYEGVAAHYKLLLTLSDIKFVQKGTPFAQYVEEVPPVNGVDVKGKEIKMNLKSKLPILKDGVENQNGVLVSTRDGRLEFEDASIRVVPQLIVPRDLTSSDGPIFSDEGDIIVEGSALEGSFIKATGTIHINGGIHYSTLLSDTGINASDNLSYSKVYCGWTELSYQRLTKHLVHLLSLLEQFRFHHHSIANEFGKKRNDLESLFFDWNKNITIDTDDELIQLVLRFGRNDIKERTLAYLECVKQFFSFKLSSPLNDIEVCTESVRSLISEVKERKVDKPCDIVVGSVDSSLIYSTGKIEVIGSGVYLSRLESGDSISSVGGVKGGNLIAKNSVSIKKFTTVEEDHYIKVLNPNGYIEMNQRGPYSLLIVDDYEELNDKPEQYIRYEKIKKEE